MSVMMSEQILVAPVNETECIWGECTREGLFEPVLSTPCACPRPHCIPHMDEINAMQAANKHHPTGWMCGSCLQTVGFIVRWERTR